MLSLSMKKECVLQNHLRIIHAWSCEEKNNMSEIVLQKKKRGKSSIGNNELPGNTKSLSIYPGTNLSGVISITLHSCQI